MLLFAHLTLTDLEIENVHESYYMHTERCKYIYLEIKSVHECYYLQTELCKHIYLEIVSMNVITWILNVTNIFNYNLLSTFKYCCMKLFNSASRKPALFLQIFHSTNLHICINVLEQKKRAIYMNKFIHMFHFYFDIFNSNTYY